MHHPVLLIFVAITSVLTTATAYADLDDPLYKLFASDGADNAIFGESVGIDGTRAIIGASQNSALVNYAGSAYIFDTTTGLQLFQLFPTVGTDEGLFGRSVAISGTKAIVGEPYGDSGDGAAHIFDATTGQLLFKLVPPVKSTGDDFGSSVAINGTIAIVGVPLDDDNGTRSGSAYLFDATTGQQLFKLLPDDGDAEDRFGNAVAISGTRAIVGAFLNDDDGSNSGSAYIFDTTTGNQLAKLLPIDGEANILFGRSVAIDGVRVVVGASSDNDNGIASGSAYIFDATTGEQLFKLLPKDGVQYEFFGRSVSISGTKVIAGAHSGGKSNVPGRAYIFDATNGQQLIKLIPIDGAAGDSFGYAVAISDVRAIMGTPGDDDQGSDSGSAYITAVDTDHDGLLDSWENNGIPYFDKGGVLQHFMLPGADPMHKDLYVEVDAMTGFSLGDAAVALLEAAYAAAPLSNPDGIDGITLHILRDEPDLPLVAFWETIAPSFCWPVQFEEYRNAHYGIPGSEQGNAQLLQAKARAYRYCIVADDAGPKLIGGCGNRPGNNFVLFVDGYNDEFQAAVFMHELGHNLSLQHGGGDGINGKPNYPSVMNYVLSYKYTWNNAFWRLDYSREDAGNFASLNEASLNELEGIGTSDGFYSNFKMPFGVNELDRDDKTIRSVKYVTLNGSPTDFGDTAGTMFQDGNFDDAVAQDLNYAVDTPVGISLPGVSSPDETLTPYNDWANVYLPLTAVLGAGVTGPNYPTDELTKEAIEWIDANFPLPPGACPWDLDNSGSVGTSDLLALFAQWGTDGSADFDGNGVVGTSDLLILFANWGPCK